MDSCGFHEPYDSSMVLRILLSTLLVAVALSAQRVTGTLEGHVKDSSGAVMAGARVTAKNAETGLTRVTSTNQEGNYQLTFLPAGNYGVTAEATGFGVTSRAAGVELNSTRVVDFDLKPAAAATQVTVTEEAPLLDTTRGDVKSNIDEQTIEDRPLTSGWRCGTRSSEVPPQTGQSIHRRGAETRRTQSDFLCASAPRR
jgi:hypothetical protein